MYLYLTIALHSDSIWFVWSRTNCHPVFVRSRVSGPAVSSRLTDFSSFMPVALASCPDMLPSLKPSGFHCPFIPGLFSPFEVGGGNISILTSGCPSTLSTKMLHPALFAVLGGMSPEVAHHQLPASPQLFSRSCRQLSVALPTQDRLCTH